MRPSGRADDGALSTHLDVRQAATLAAMVDTIVPADGYPSGTQAGVLDYYAVQFASDLIQQRERYRLGLDALDAEAEAGYAKSFASLVPQLREVVLRRVELGEVSARWPVDPRGFVAAAVGHVMEGFYGDPDNGGNRASVSWDMVGFRVGD